MYHNTCTAQHGTSQASHAELVKRESLKTEEEPPDAAGDGEDATKWEQGNETGCRLAE